MKDLVAWLSHLLFFGVMSVLLPAALVVPVAALPVDVIRTQGDSENMLETLDNRLESYTAPASDFGSFLGSLSSWDGVASSGSKSYGTVLRRSVSAASPASPISQAITTLLVVLIICTSGIVCFVFLWGLRYGFRFVYSGNMRSWPLFDRSWNLRSRKKMSPSDTQTTAVSHHLLTSALPRDTSITNVWEADNITGPRELSSELELFTLTEYSTRGTDDLFDNVVGEPPRISIPGMRGIRISDSEPTLLDSLHDAIHTEIQEERSYIISDEDDTPLVIFDNDQSSEAGEDDDTFRILVSPNPWDMEQDDGLLFSANSPILPDLFRPRASEKIETAEPRVALTPDTISLENSTETSLTRLPNTVGTPAMSIKNTYISGSDADQENPDNDVISLHNASETIPQSSDNAAQQDADINKGYVAEMPHADSHRSNSQATATASNKADNRLSIDNRSAAASPCPTNSIPVSDVGNPIESIPLSFPDTPLVYSNDGQSLPPVALPHGLTADNIADDEECESSQEPGSPALTSSSAADFDSPLLGPSFLVEDTSTPTKQPLSVEVSVLDDPDYLPLPGAMPGVLQSPTSPVAVTRPAWSLRASNAATLILSPNAPAVELPTIELPSMYQEPQVVGAFPTSTETPPAVVVKKPKSRGGKAYRSREPHLDLAFAMQLRPGLGPDADPAWMVRFLMAMFGYLTLMTVGTRPHLKQRIYG